MKRFNKCHKTWHDLMWNLQEKNTILDFIILTILVTAYSRSLSLSLVRGQLSTVKYKTREKLSMQAFFTWTNLNLLCPKRTQKSCPFPSWVEWVKNEETANEPSEKQQRTKKWSKARKMSKLDQNQQDKTCSMNG